MSRTLMAQLCACGLVLLLAACGGGGGAGDGAPPTVPAPNPGGGGGGGGGTNPALAEATTLLATYANPVSYTALATIPTTGSATYTGHAYGDLANTSDSITNTLLGGLTMAVTFSASSASVSGQITGFSDADGDAVTGVLSLSGGRLNRAGNPSADPTLGVTVTGALTDDQNRILTIGARLEGDFLGTGHAAVGGDFLGSVTVNGTRQDLNGGFIAAR